MADWLKNQLTRFRVREAEQISARDTIRDTIIDTVFKYSGVKVRPGAVICRGRVVFLKVKPLEKSEILLKQKPILRECQDRLGRKAPRRLL